MQLVTTVFTVERPSRGNGAHILRGCREETAITTGHSHGARVESCAPAGGDGPDGSDANCAWSANSSCIVVSPAIVVGTSTNVVCKLHNMEREIGVRLLLHYDSRTLLSKKLSEIEICQGECTIVVPPLEEGIVSFVLLEEGEEGLGTILCTVSCCVVPSLVAQDLNKMLNTMITNSNEEPLVAYSEMSVLEQSGKLWIWTDHFCKFLGDVELLFEWMESDREQVGIVMEVFVNVLKHCCLYESWHLGAHLLNKAQDCGLEILANQIPTTGSITPEQLRSVMCENDEESNEKTTQFSSRSTQDSTSASNLEI